MPWPKSSTRDADNIAFAEHYADVYAAVAVAAVARAPEDAGENFALDSEFSFPLGASSVIIVKR